jgi:hypothetical protein
MTLNAEQTLAKAAGDLWLADYPLAAPTEAVLAVDASLISAGWVHAGWLHEDGPEPEGFEGENTKHYGWNAVAPIRSVTRVTEPMIPVSLLQWNSISLSYYFPGATYDEGDQTLTIPENGVPANQSLLLRVIDGSRFIGIWGSKVTPRGGGAFSFPGDGLAPIPVIYDVLSTGDDDNFVKVIGVPLDADESSS